MPAASLIEITLQKERVETAAWNDLRLEVWESSPISYWYQISIEDETSL